MSKEFWLNVVGFNGLYRVSNIGTVSSLKRGSHFGKKPSSKWYVKKSSKDKNGYEVVALFNKSRKMFKVHRLVAMAFIPNPENKPCVNHINGCPFDNRVENLEWATISENTKHAFSELNRVPYFLGRTGSLCKTSKSIKQIDIGTKTLLNIFGSIREASRKTGVHKSSIIKSAKTNKSTKGYLWQYA